MTTTIKKLVTDFMKGKNEYVDADRDVTYSVLEFIYETYGNGVMVRFQEVVGMPVFKIGISNISSCTVELPVLQECAKRCRNRLSELVVSHQKTAATPSLRLELDIFFSSSGTSYYPSQFRWPEYQDAVTDDFSKSMKGFDRFQACSHRRHNERVVRDICQLVHNSDQFLPVIDTTLVEREESFSNGGGDGIQKHYVCDIQFTRMQQVRFSFLEFLFQTVGRKLFNVIFSPTHSEGLSMRLWLLPCCSSITRTLTVGRIMPHLPPLVTTENGHPPPPPPPTRSGNPKRPRENPEMDKDTSKHAKTS